MSIHPMESPTVCLVSIEVNYLTVTSDCSCLVVIRIDNMMNVLIYLCVDLLSAICCKCVFGHLLILIFVLHARYVRTVMNIHKNDCQDILSNVS